MLYRGVFINLDRSNDRRAMIEAQNERLGLSYARFPAIDGRTVAKFPKLNPAETGCFQSHLAALEEASNSSEITHIIEDDAVLSPRLAEIVSAAILKGLFKQHDIVYGALSLFPDIAHLRPLKGFCDKARGPSGDYALAQLMMVDVRNLWFFGLHSYFVTPAGARRMVGLLKAAVKSPSVPAIDYAVRNEAKSGRLNAACFFPFVTSLSPAAVTTVGRAEMSRDLEFLRRLTDSFYIESSKTADAQLDMIVGLIREMLTP